MDMMVFERDWASTIPTDILHAILDKLLEPKDHANFSVVCCDWHLARKDYIRKRPLLPMLMVPTRLDIDNDDDDQDLYSRTERSLYCISIGKIYDISGLSIPDKIRYCGSSHGWLATVENKTAIVLVNPFRNALTIHLPRLDFDVTYGSDEYNIYKVILTADPISNPSSYFVVAIYGANRYLAFYKSNQNSWVYIDKSLTPTPISDVIMHEGSVYAIDEYGSYITSFDVNIRSEPWVLKLFKARKSMRLNCSAQQYLVASSKGVLLQVQRCLDLGNTEVTKSFEVFRLQLVEEKGEGIVDKVEVKSLGNDAMFLGENHSFAISINNLRNRFRLCQPNFIYYTGEFFRDRIYENHKDVGSFNFEDKTFRRYYKHHPFQEWNKKMSRPLWISPLLL